MERQVPAGLGGGGALRPVLLVPGVSPTEPRQQWGAVSSPWEAEPPLTWLCTPPPHTQPHTFTCTCAHAHTHTLMATECAGSLPRGPQDSPGQPGRGHLPVPASSITLPPVGLGLGEVECPWEIEVGSGADEAWQGRLAGPPARVSSASPFPLLQALLPLQTKHPSGQQAQTSCAPAGTTASLLGLQPFLPPPVPEGCPGSGSPQSPHAQPPASQVAILVPLPTGLESKVLFQ